MLVQYDRFPGGRTRAVALSFDDGREQDRRLVERLNAYGLKGTFHLNSGSLGQEGYISLGEAAALYEGHEISAHTVRHPFLEQLPPEQAVKEILADREALEGLSGYPVRGMSYPFGNWSEGLAAMLPSLGIEYARTVASHGTFAMPANPLLWGPTCHQRRMLEQGERFATEQPIFKRMALLCIWGHSWEFDRDDSWAQLDQFGELIGGRPEIWYAGLGEIAAYRQAVDRLRVSVSGRLIHNPSAAAVWVGVEGQAVEIPGGTLIRL